MVFAALALLTSAGNMALFVLLPMLWAVSSPEKFFSPKALSLKALLVMLILALGYVLFTFEPGVGFRFMQGDAVPFSGLGNAYMVQPLGFTALKEFLVYNMYVMLPFIPLRSVDPSLPVSLLAMVCFFFLIVVFGTGVKLPRLAAVWMVVGILPYALFVPTGNADRYFYLASAGYALMAARLLLRLYDLSGQPVGVSMLELMLVGLLGVYGIAGTLVIRTRINEWFTAEKIASRVVAETLDQHPVPLKGQQMLFVNLPGTYGQAYLYLSGGISRDVSQAYLEAGGMAVEAYQVNDPEVIAYVRNLPDLTGGEKTALTIFLYESGRLIEKDGATADLEQLKPALWTH